MGLSLPEFQKDRLRDRYPDTAAIRKGCSRNFRKQHHKLTDKNDPVFTIYDESEYGYYRTTGYEKYRHR